MGGLLHIVHSEEVPGRAASKMCPVCRLQLQLSIAFVSSSSASSERGRYQLSIALHRVSCMHVPVGVISHCRTTSLQYSDGVAVTRANATPGRPESARVRREYMALRADVVGGRKRYSRYVSLVVTSLETRPVSTTHRNIHLHTDRYRQRGRAMQSVLTFRGKELARQRVRQ